jgi:hypothetical protein
VPPGGSCTIVIQFLQSSGTGVTTNTATVRGGPPNQASAVLAAVPLTANSVTPTHTATVAPSPLEFGHVTATTSATQNLTVTNTGNSALANLTFTFGGGSPQPFTRVQGGGFPAGAPNCGTSLAVGAACTVKVQFLPTTATTFSRSLTIAGGNGATVTGSPVTLHGIGDAPPAPGTPTGGSASRGGNGGQITADLNWADTQYATSYDVQWSTSQGTINANGGAVITNASTSSAYTFNGGANGLGSGTTVFFKVRAVNSTGTSGWSAAFSSTVR